MRHIIINCKKCGKKYTFQASGKGCFNQKCSQYFCEKCLPEMNIILEKVRNKFKNSYLLYIIEDERYKFSVNLEITPEHINFVFNENLPIEKIKIDDNHITLKENNA